MSHYNKRKILILTYEDHVPPRSVEGIDLERVDWKLEYDVLSSLNAMGQDVKILGVNSDLRKIRDAIERWQPDIAFNLLDEFDGEAIFDQNVVSYLELLHIPYTGSNPRGLILSRDKALAKKLLSYHRIPVPDFLVFRKNQKVTIPKNLEFPVIVKSLTEHSSLGISKASVVNDSEKLVERVRFMHEKVQTDVLVETFIEGRELYVGVLGNARVQVLPVWEMYFNKKTSQTPQFATAKVKWDPNYRQKHGITTDRAKELDPATEKRIHSICKRVYRILGLNGYARMDLRLRNDGKIFVLEANPNPHIGYGEDFAESAEKAGISYKDLLWRIISLGSKWNPADVRTA